MPKAENESFLGANRETSEVFPIPYSLSFPEVDREKSLPQPEIQRPQEISPLSESELPLQPEVQPLKERQPNQPPLSSQETIKDWLERLIKEAEEKGRLTEEDKKKLVCASMLWVIDGTISTVVGGPILAASSLLWRTYGNPLFLLYNLIPGALRVGTIIVAEKLADVKFSRTSKVLTFWPVFPSGWAMPYEVASVLGKRQLLSDKIKERYLTTPLVSIRSAFQDFCSVFRR